MDAISYIDLVSLLTITAHIHYSCPLLLYTHPMLSVLPSVAYLVSTKRGALGYIRNGKTEEKIIQNHKTAKNLPKTETRIQNCQKWIQWWQVGHTEGTTLTLILSKYLWMSWTCLKPLYSIFKLLQASLFPFHFTSKCVFLSKILPVFPLLIKKLSTIHNCFFRCCRWRHVGNWPNDCPGLRGQSLGSHSRCIIPLLWHLVCHAFLLITWCFAAIRDQLPLKSKSNRNPNRTK